MGIEKILKIVQKVRAWAETGEVKELPAAAELIIACDEIIKMIEKEMDDLK